MMRKVFAVRALAAFTIVATPCLAAPVLAEELASPDMVGVQDSVSGETTINMNERQVVVSGHMSVGWLNGEATELVYDKSGIFANGHKNSQLNWEMKNVPMLNVGGSISPAPNLTLSADFWTKLNRGNGDMDDYDWLALNYSGYTDWSHHEETNLTKGMMLDLNAAYTFYSWQNTDFKGLIGYKYDTWEWESWGGSYQYSSYWHFDTVGSWANSLRAISYKQTYQMPYVGLAFDSTVGRLLFTGRIIGSPLVYAEAEDTHHMRDLHWDMDMERSSMFALDFGMGYFITDNLMVNAMFRYQQYNEARGDANVTDLATGEKARISTAEFGADQKSSMISVGVNYSF